MSATPDSTLANPEHRIADLERQLAERAAELAECRAERDEALAQQTATAEVLQVINSSPGDLAPVFDAMLEKAMRLCRAEFGEFFITEAEQLRAVAVRGVAAAFAEFRNRNPAPPIPGSITARIRSGEAVIHVADVKDDDLYRRGDLQRCALVDLGGARTFLSVTLIKDRAVLGSINIFRQEVRPFSDKQISLLQNFAAQAVIAIENARLLTETREALDQQTATAEILDIINSSPGNTTPVFDAILETAMRLCGAAFGVLNTYDGEQFRTAAARGVPATFAEFRAQSPPAPGPGTGRARILAGERVVHNIDLMAEEAYRVGDPSRLALVDLGGARSALQVALRKDETVRGYIVVYRKEVRPFSEKEIALIENFAAQAVIAMENAQRITETREALEQQTATAEVLQVINSSPGDLAPVFDAILEKAHSLCGAMYGGLATYDGEHFRVVAARGYPAQLVQAMRRPRRGSSLHQRLMRGERYVHVPDLSALAPELIGVVGSATSEAGFRTMLLVPLRKDGTLLGHISASRQEVRPFSDKEIALLESFAAQAVIAMDNARLLNEIRQRQAELRVTFDNMGDGVAMFDSELRLAAWNLNFQRILELPDTLLAERPLVADVARYLATHGEYGAVDVEAEVRRLSERVGTPWSTERTRPDGRVIEVWSNPVPGGGVVLIYSDVTERKRAEAEIRAARDTAEKALGELQAAQASLLYAQKMAALGQLTAGIAHEIKNPLNFVNNFAELSGELLLELKKTTAPAVVALGEDERAAVDEVFEMLRGNLDKIAEHGKRADGIVKSMLEHSRGVSGERRVIDLNALIEEALNLAYHGARAQDASFNIILEREFDRGLAPTELAPQEMTRVFLNLFGNGFYATAKRQRDGVAPGFRPTLRVVTRDLGDEVEIRVRDNGTGIAPEIRDKLFQPFVTTKPTGEGTGLGLSIAWDIVTQQHGGTISVDSRVDEFTEFTIRLPRAYGAAIVEAAA
jgi:signal transduction histidine kinase/prephenate dehydratase